MRPETMTPKEIIKQLEDLLKNGSFLNEFERLQNEFTSKQLSDLLIGIVEKKVNAGIDLDIEKFKNVVTKVVEFESSTDNVNKMQGKDLGRVADRIIFAGKEDQREFNKAAFDIFLDHNNNSPERLTALLKQAVISSDSYFIDKILKIEITKDLSSEQLTDILKQAVHNNSMHFTEVFNFANKQLSTEQLTDILKQAIASNNTDLFETVFSFAKDKGLSSEQLTDILKQTVIYEKLKPFTEVFEFAKGKGLLNEQGNINNILSSIVTHNRVGLFKEFAQHVTTEQLITALKDMVNTKISDQNLKNILDEADGLISIRDLKEIRKHHKIYINNLNDSDKNTHDKLRVLDRCIEDRKLIKGYMAPILTACGSAAIGAALVYLEVIAFPMVFTALAAGVIGLFIPMAINVVHEKYENFKFEPRTTEAVNAAESTAQPSVS
jgi:hypothetical protein